MCATPPDRQAEALPASLWSEFFQGSRLACARVITRVENNAALVPVMRDALASRLGRAVRIGITGPPGVGKSTLTSAIAKGLADQGHGVGVIAVDPSSPFTGGAFMGDRVRMDAAVGDERIYIRSLASREGQGGLSPATPYVADVLEGFGMDRILIETVGVGQAELDVLRTADIVVLVLQPSTGDAIQTMKAGIIEAADLIVVNKADLPGVDSVLQSLRFLFSLSGPVVTRKKDGAGTKAVIESKPGHQGWQDAGLPKAGTRTPPPVLATSAQKSEGIAELVAEVERQATTLVESGRHLELRKRRLAGEIQQAIQRNLWETFLERAHPDIEGQAAHLAKDGGSPYAYVRDVCSKVEIQIKGE